jgi:hypothetical protein
MMGGQGYIYTNGDSMISNPNDIHARSVDHTNQLPYKLNGSRNQYPGYNQTGVNYNNYMFSLDNNNFVTNNPYMAYSFCGADKNNPAYFNKMPMNMKPINDEKAMIDNIMVLIKDQNGCRMLQRKFEEKKVEFLFKFYERVIL